MSTRLLLPMLVAAAVLPLAGGCATVQFDPVPSDAADQCADGFRYYKPAVYLLAWSDGNGNVKTQVKVMPDQTRKMTAKPVSVWSKLKTELTFENGVLSTSNTKGEAAAVPKAAFEIVKSAAGTITSLVALTDAQALAEGRVPAPLLFKIVPEGPPGTYVLYGSAELEPIKVTVNPKS